ncbi:MAG: cytochrome P450 [Myxococcota bacterium]
MASRGHGRKLLRDTWRLLRDPLPYYDEVRRQRGDFAELSLGPRPARLVSDPAAVAEILRRDVDEFRKGYGNDALAPLIAGSVFLAEGEAWKRQRPIMVAALRRRVLAERLPIVATCVDAMLDRWFAEGTRAEVNLADEIRESSTSIASRALLGSPRFDEDPSLRADLDAVWREIYRRLVHPLSARLSGSRRRAYEQALRRVFEAARACVEHGATQDEPHPSPLAVLLESADLSDEEALAEAMMLIVTGQECVAIATTWALVLLAQHAPARARVREEFDVAAAGEHAVGTVGWVESLTYTRAAVDEAMRLYPPAWMFSRRSERPIELEGATIGEDEEVLICPHVTHRDEGRWTEPKRFDPTRFLPKGEGRTTARRSYLPFGSGPRTCAGIVWARWQAVATVALVVGRADLDVPHDARPPRRPGLTLRPEGPLPSIVRALPPRP